MLHTMRYEARAIQTFINIPITAANDRGNMDFTWKRG